MPMEPTQLFDTASEPTLEELKLLPEEELVDPSVLARDFSSGSLVHLYLKEIAAVPVISPEKEQELLQTIAAGTQAEAQLADGLAGAENDALKKSVRKGERARQDLTEGNVRLVLTVAKRFVGKGLPFLDLIQEGSLGLLKAAGKFHSDMGCKFSAYAAWWIQRAIETAIEEQSQAARIPAHMIESYNELTRLSRQLTEQLGRNPSTQELADAMKMTADEVLELFKIAQESDSPAPAMGDSEPDYITEEEEAAADRQTSPSHVLTEALEALGSQEALLLKLHFGLEDGRAHTLEELGAEFSMTDRQVQDVIRGALAKLQEMHPELRKALS